MTTSAPGACSAPRQRLRSALLSLQRLLHPSPLPLARSIAARGSRALFPPVLRLPDQGALIPAALPGRTPSPAAPLSCPRGTAAPLAAPGSGLRCAVSGALTPLPGLRLPSAGSVPVPAAFPLHHPSALPPRAPGGHWGSPQHCPPAPRYPRTPPPPHPLPQCPQGFRSFPS